MQKLIRINFFCFLFLAPAFGRAAESIQPIVSETWVDIDGDGAKELVTLTLSNAAHQNVKNDFKKFEAWTGTYTVSVYRNQKRIGFKDIGEFSFKNKFTISFDDYNNDGFVDFGLMAASWGRGCGYRLFTIDKNGGVYELPILTSEGFMELGMMDYSSKISRYKGYLTSVIYYADGASRVFYKWNGQGFVHVKNCPSRTMGAEGSQEQDITAEFNDPMCSAN